MRIWELNKFFNNEREAFEYRDEVWFDYRVMGTVYACTQNNKHGYIVEFDED